MERKGRVRKGKEENGIGGKGKGMEQEKGKPKEEARAPFSWTMFCMWSVRALAEELPHIRK